MARTVALSSMKLLALTYQSNIKKGNIMGKPQHRVNPRAVQALEDLASYLEFCVDYGYRYREEDLYNFKAYAWQQYNKFSQGKNAKNMWLEDARRLGRNI
jgi:cysteinyl-tRNA synthetase